METKPTDIQLDAATKKFFSEVLGQVRTVFCSYDESQLQEPWLTHYRKIKNDYDSAIKELGPIDGTVAALHAHNHMQSLYSMLAGATSMCGMLQGRMEEMKKNANCALNSAVEAEIQKRIASGDLLAKADVEGKVTAGVTAEIDRRVKAGELLSKDTHTQLCSAAKDLGITEGRTAAEKAANAEKEKAATVEKRKQSLVTNGIPMPTKDIDKVLAGTDAEFETRQTTAKSRMTALMGKGVVLNSEHVLWGNIWLPEDEYKTFEGLVENMTTGEPFARETRAGNKPTGRMLV